MDGMTTARGKLFLAPMAGYTNLPFRLLCAKYGADAAVSEMVSAKGLYYNDKKTARLMESAPGEKLYGIQLFGSEPDILAHAANEICTRRRDGSLDFDFIDFNAGCPAPKIVKNGDGSALLQKPALLSQCIEALVKAADVPVTVKMRSGFTADTVRPAFYARIAEQAGASMLTVHGRTRTQFYEGHSDWNAVAAAAAAVDIPVILSGDIKTAEDGRLALETGAAGLMVGRGAVGNPMLFSQLRAVLDGTPVPQYGAADKIDAALMHLSLTLQYSESRCAIIELRKSLAAYTKGLPEAASMRTQLFAAQTEQDVKSIFEAAARRL